MSSAKRHNLDVWKYLKDVLDRVLAGETDYSKLLPDVWKREHPEAVRVYREEESRYKSDRKQQTRARRIIARPNSNDSKPQAKLLSTVSLPVVDAYSRLNHRSCIGKACRLLLRQSTSRHSASQPQLHHRRCTLAQKRSDDFTTNTVTNIEVICQNCSILQTLDSKSPKSSIGTIF